MTTSDGRMPDAETRPCPVCARPLGLDEELPEPAAEVRRANADRDREFYRANVLERECVRLVNGLRQIRGGAEGWTKYSLTVLLDQGRVPTGGLAPDSPAREIPDQTVDIVAALGRQHLEYQNEKVTAILLRAQEDVDTLASELEITKRELRQVAERATSDEAIRRAQIAQGRLAIGPNEIIGEEHNEEIAISYAIPADQMRAAITAALAVRAEHTNARSAPPQ
jgi:hypothetical protein